MDTNSAIQESIRQIAAEQVAPEVIRILGVDTFSFLSGCASIIGLFLAVWGIRQGIKKLTTKRSPIAQQNIAGDSNVGQIYSEGGITLNLGESDDDSKLLKDLAAFLDVKREPPTPQDLGHPYEDLKRSLEKKLEDSAPLAGALLIANRIAKARNDSEDLRWLDDEMKGYDTRDIKNVDGSIIKGRTMEGYFLMKSGNFHNNLPYEFFCPYSIDRIEELLAQLHLHPDGKYMIDVDTPQDVSGFFGERGITVPDRLTIYFETSCFQGIIRYVRKRLWEILKKADD